MGWVIATTINLSTAIFLGLYFNIPLVTLPFVMVSDFYKGMVGDPAEMRYRPDYQQFGLDCGEGGKCGD